ncbi:MAG TPA: glycosyltransferase family A protein [Gaiellaceae bacterium]|nr:glycosyltransferase family A protein [Gaiellaceae bacterium]
MTVALRYAVISPVREESANLQRLASCLAEQTMLPARWVIVDNGSSDDTPEVAAALARQYEWAESTTAAAAPTAGPGAPVVRAFHTGLALLPEEHDIIVKQDADTSMASDYFERVLTAFAADDRLGIAGGSCYEERDGRWVEINVTGDHVRGASRFYRRECLDDVLPLEERLGWDGIDELKAAVRGWRTRIVRDAPFYHHRRVGQRDGASTARWRRQGVGAHYMGYRFTYLLLRTAHHALKNPAAVAMVSGYVGAALRRESRLADQDVRHYLREQQRLRRLPARWREAAGRN